jgi:hypothetical protein
VAVRQGARNAHPRGRGGGACRRCTAPARQSQRRQLGRRAARRRDRRGGGLSRTPLRERRALEGELYLLEEAWQQAEEIAAIADDMFLPPSIDAGIARLREASGRDASAPG